MRSRTKPFKVVAAYDTETCNIKRGDAWVAYTVCFQVNDLRDCDMYGYEPDVSDNVYIYRDASDMIAFIGDLVAWGLEMQVCPIVAGYNLMFDLQPLMAALHALYDMEVNAQSSTNVYTLDLYRDGVRVLRFWDTFHLEMRGLDAMGRTAGLAKLNGEWDYTLIRTPETPLTSEEEAYATRDVQVIPAYMRYLLHANPWMHEGDLGVKVITKTSIVRQMAQHEIAKLRYRTDKGYKTLLQTFMAICNEDLPACYYDYGLRKACFRGGLTFTAARYASVVVTNVASLDVTSMHHTFINGSFMPEQFRPVKPGTLRTLLERTFSTSVDNVLKTYWRPFPFAYHARVRFYKLRLKQGTPFDAYGIALIPKGKFQRSPEPGTEFSVNDAAQFADSACRMAGWRDRAVNPVFAFGKLYTADVAEIHVSEYEAWCIFQVYDFDFYEPILGEATAKLTAPPDYVTLQSNMLFERKQDMKHVNKVYKEGMPYPEEVPASIPDGIANGLRTGSLSNDFVASYYGSTVKGAFNSVYGTQAQDVLKPGYVIDDASCIAVDTVSVLTEENFFGRLPDTSKVMYTYGMRIVGRSRMHLVIAIYLLWQRFGERVRVTGGDTDSVKCSCDRDITDAMLIDALRPIADASKAAIDTTMRRVRRDWPRYASTLDGIGAFDIEECERGKTRWSYHMEAWNKCRVSVGSDMRCHITAAGVSRPHGAYTIESYIDRMLRYVPPEQALPDCIGYNVYVPVYLAHSLQRTRPLPIERFEDDVTDYLGIKTHVDAPQAVALYPVGRWLGETSMPSNMENVIYLKRVYGRDVRTDMRSLMHKKKGVPVVLNDW